METILLNALLLVSLLVLSGFFSGTETALFSLNKSDLHRFSLSKNMRERRIFRDMSKPDRILITILLGNLLVNIFLTSITTQIILHFFGEYGHIFSILIVTPVVIVMCEITPKIIALNKSVKFAKMSYPLLTLFHKLFLPVRIFILLFTGFFIRIFKLQLGHDPLTEDELGHVIKSGELEGVIDKQESDIIKNVIMFSKREASNVMYPRNQAILINKNATINEAMELVITNDVVRIPVFDKDIDSIIGVIDSRDLLPAYLGVKKIKKITRYIRPIEFFPFSRDLNELLTDFLIKKIQIAILVDEYGGTAGVVTLNSILSAIMGKEFGSWDSKQRLIKEMNDNSFLVNGELQLDEFNSYFNKNLTSNNSDTFGGYITEQLNHFPEKEETLEIEDIKIIVKNIRKRKIETLKVLIHNEEDINGH